MKYGLTFDSEEQAHQVIESFKASIAKEGDTYDEVINLSPSLRLLSLSLIRRQDRLRRWSAAVAQSHPV